MKVFVWFFLAAQLLILSGCGVLPLDPHAKPPPVRPEELNQYYAKGNSYSAFSSTLLQDKIHYTVNRYTIKTDKGDITIDYYKKPTADENLIFVFPLLGGKNVIADYFAEYFVQHGFDAAIVHRNNDFKDPKYFDQLEEVLRDNVVRDRIAIDFFEKEMHKKTFGTFGISRGAINVAMTAGVDPRLKYNVMAMGGTDMVDIFRYSHQRRLKFYRNSVMEQKGLSKEEFFNDLRAKLRTDPDHLAGYLDPKNTLLFLSVFDRTVPIKYGRMLRKQIGNPKTVLLLADHYTSILYTQYAPLLPPIRKIGIFPLDYIETQAMDFYEKSFGISSGALKMMPYRLLQLPSDIIFRTVDAIFD